MSNAEKKMAIPAGDWTFKNIKVAEAFDSHVREQLPWYDIATGAVSHIARHYIAQNGLIYDIGASTGNIGRSLASTIESRSASLIGIEPSEEMCAIYSAPGKLVMADAMDFAFQPFDVAICFLVLMFMPVTKRRDFIRRLVKKIKPGGALIVFDKMEVHGGYISTIMHRMTIAGKVSTGTSADDIIAKELSLGGIQRPLPPGFIHSAAPDAVEVFRFGEFTGWVIERPE